jgi:hypothetical protein
LREVRRAGFAPVLWKEEVDLELEFHGERGAAIFRVMVGATGASDLRIAEGTALELAAGHLRDQEPGSWLETCAAWRIVQEPDAAWALGARLSRPVRIEMTKPYISTVGFAFDCKRHGEMIGRLILFAESDILFAVREDHPEVTKYGLRELHEG